MNRTIPLALASILAAGVLTTATATAASAHDGLIASSPANGDTVSTRLDTVQLRFSDNFLTIGGSTAPFAVQVQGPDGTFANRGCVELDGSAISTAVSLGESGEYTVTWQVVSSDGHTTSDSYSFSYDRPTDVDASPGFESGVTCDPSTGEAIEPAPAETAEPGETQALPSQTPAAAEPASFVGPAIAFAGVAALFAVICVGFVVMLRLRRANQ